MGHMVEVVLPKYDTIDYENQVEGFKEIKSFEWGGCTNRVFTGLVEDLQVHFIQPGNVSMRKGPPPLSLSLTHTHTLSLSWQSLTLFTSFFPLTLPSSFSHHSFFPSLIDAGIL